MNEMQKDLKKSEDMAWDIVRQWWDTLQKDSGKRASLRRAHNAMEAATQMGYFDLYHKMIGGDTPDFIKRGLDFKLPYVAGILSHIKEDDPNHPVARSMSLGAGESDRPVSDLRFRRLIKIDEYDELYIMMIRMIRMLKSKANVMDMAQSIFFWNDRTKRQWANHYYIFRKDG